MKMAPLSLKTSEADAIAPGTSKCLTVDGTAIIVYKAADGSLKATLKLVTCRAQTCFNRSPDVKPFCSKCQHFGGTFVPDVEDVGKMKCTFHGWKLDPSKMEYCTGSNPAIMGMQMKQPEGTKQPEFIVSKNEAGYSLAYPAGLDGKGGCSVC